MLIKVLMTLHCRKAKYSGRKARYPNCNLAFYLEIAKA